MTPTSSSSGSPSGSTRSSDRARGHGRAGGRGPGLGRRAPPARSPTRWPPSAGWRSTCMPEDLAGRVRASSTTTSSRPRRASAFEELLEELRQEVADTYFKGRPRHSNSMDPEQMARMRDALDALNKMLEQRETGEPLDPTFEQFMEQFGDMFPGDPEDLDELLEQLARGWRRPRRCGIRCRPSSATSCASWPSRCWRTWTCAGRWSGSARNLQRAFPDAGWGQRLPVHRRRPAGHVPGDRPCRRSWASWTGWRTCSSRPPRRPRLAEVDLDEVRRQPGRGRGAVARPPGQADPALEEAGLIEQQGGRTELTPKGSGAWARRR